MRAEGVQWIALAAHGSEIAWLRAGAWAVLGADSDREVAEETARCISARARAAVEGNPLTGLPGNPTIARFLEAEVIGREMLAAWVDITDFKPFNDHYGFARGDSVIRLLASCLCESLHGCFVGHVGGDDFVCAGPAEVLAPGLDKAGDAFRETVRFLYSAPDRSAGGIEALDRFGRFRFFPFADLSVSIVDGSRHTSVEGLARSAGRDRKRRRGDPVPASASEVLAPDRGGGRGSLADLLRGKIAGGRFDTSDMKAILEAAGATGDSGMLEGLSGVLEGDLCPGLRKSAALALGSLCGPDSTGILLQALSDPSPHVRTRAVEALSTALGSRSADLAARATLDRSSWVRRAALRALGRAGGEGALGILLEAAEKGAGGKTPRDCDEERKAALEGLARLGSPLASPRLLAMLGWTGEPVRAALWLAVAGCPSVSCAVALSRALGAEASACAALEHVSTTDAESRAILEKATLELIVKGGDACLHALRFLSSAEGPLPDRVGEAVLETLRICSGPAFSAAVSVVRRRGLPLSKADVEAVSAEVRSNPCMFEREPLLVFVDCAARSCRSPGAFLGLIRSGERDIALAAARAVLGILEAETARTGEW
jgi:GGDEF domain-containing protein